MFRYKSSVVFSLVDYSWSKLVCRNNKFQLAIIISYYDQLLLAIINGREGRNQTLLSNGLTAG